MINITNRLKIFFNGTNERINSFLKIAWDLRYLEMVVSIEFKNLTVILIKVKVFNNLIFNK